MSYPLLELTVQQKPDKRWALLVNGKEIGDTKTEFDARFALHTLVAEMIEGNRRWEEMKHALEQSLKLQSHYAQLLNTFDGGERIQFNTIEAWLTRVRASDEALLKLEQKVANMKVGETIDLPGKYTAAELRAMGFNIPDDKAA